MSAASVASESATETMSAAEIIAVAKSLTAMDLFKVLKAFTTEAEKRSKSDTKAAASKRVKKEKKEKGAVPVQLRKNHAWVAFTLAHALENGWESFVITKKDEEIEMPASIIHESTHIYKDSITEKTPAGRQINRSEAMTLAKVRKDNNHETWAEFEGQFVPDEAPESSDDTKSTTSSTVVRKTASEKEKEKAEKKAAKEAEKAEKKAAAEKAKAEKKAAKEAEKEEKKAAKETAVKVAPAPVPKKASGGAGAKSESESEAPKKPVKTATKVAVKAKEDKVPSVEDDGKAHLVNWKGKAYYMMASGEAWEQTKEKSMGKWAGMFDAEKNILDTTVEEPVFEDEE